MPPTVTRQRAGNNGTPAPQRPTGSILAQAVPVSSIETEYIKICIYGQNRVGKTTLACGRIEKGKYIEGSGFPKPLLLVSFEPAETGGGANSVRKIPDVHFLHIKSTAEANKLAGELQTDTHFKTHVLDGAANWERMHLQDVLGVDVLTEQLGRNAHGGITREHYTDRTERMKNQLRLFLNLKAHTVLLCREKDHQPPKDQFKPRMMRGFEPESFFASDLSGGTVGWMHDAFDYIARLYMEREVRVEETTTKMNGRDVVNRTEVETGRIVRRLRTIYHPNYAAGFRSCDPDTVPEWIDDPTYQKIKDVIDGKPLAKK